MTNKLRSFNVYGPKSLIVQVLFQNYKKRMPTFVHVSIFSHPCHCEFLSKSFVYHVKPKIDQGWGLQMVEISIRSHIRASNQTSNKENILDI